MDELNDVAEDVSSEYCTNLFANKEQGFAEIACGACLSTLQLSRLEMPFWWPKSPPSERASQLYSKSHFLSPLSFQTDTAYHMAVWPKVAKLAFNMAPSNVIPELELHKMSLHCLRYEPRT